MEGAWTEKRCVMNSHPPENLQETKRLIAGVIAESEAAWRAMDARRMADAVAACGRWLRDLPVERVLASGAPDAGDPCVRERATLWLWWGRLLVLADNPAALQAGLDGLDQAIVRLRAAMADGRGGSADWARPALAIAWMNRGQGCTRRGGPDDLRAAIGCYDQAIGLLLDGGDVNALGASLMNRAVLLLRLDDAAGAEAALRQAIDVLTPLAATSDAAARNLTSVWSNLGVLRMDAGEPAAALAAHREALVWLRPVVAKGGVAGALDLAARLTNLAQAADAAGEFAEALAAGREALGLISTSAGGDAVQRTGLWLRAAHGICAALGGQLAARPDAAERAAWIEEAGDVLERGLAEFAAIKAGTGAGETAALATRLYGYGAWFYRLHQPRFLPEFLIEHLDATEARAKAAAEAVVAARQDVVQRGFEHAAGGGLERDGELLRGLSAVEERVRAIYKQLNIPADQA